MLLSFSSKVLGFASALLMGMTACSVGGKESMDPTTAGSSPERSPESIRSGVVEQVPTWNFPTSIKGWKIDIHDKDGMFRANNAKGCVLFTSQNFVEGASGSDLDVTKGQRDKLVSTLTSKLTRVKVEESSEDRVASKGKVKDHVQGLAMEISYTGQDGVAYKGWYWFRAFTRGTYPVSMMADYVCPEQDYSIQDAKSLFSKNLYIEYGEPDSLK